MLRDSPDPVIWGIWLNLDCSTHQQDAAGTERDECAHVSVTPTHTCPRREALGQHPVHSEPRTGTPGHQTRPRISEFQNFRICRIWGSLISPGGSLLALSN